MALTREQSAAQLLLEAANNWELRAAIAAAIDRDPEVWDLLMRGPNSPKLAGRHVEIAQRVRDILQAAGVKLASDSLARWFAPELCVGYMHPAPGSDATTPDGRFISGAGYGGERM